MYLLAWTTTPWTLPGNVALAVGDDIDYVALNAGSEIYIVSDQFHTKTPSLNIPMQVFQGDKLLTIKGK